MMIRQIFDRIKRYFVRSYREANPEPRWTPRPEHKPEPSRRSDHVVAWCRAFNRRNGWIVPDRSPESIYRSAHRRAH